MLGPGVGRDSSFGLWASFVIRHSSFVISPVSIEIQPYAPGREAAVKAFNQRLRDGGNPTFRLPENCVSTWLPPDEGEPLFEEFLLANDGEFVRGGYVLKHQPYWINGAETSIGYVYSPISEGTVNPQFGKVGLQVMMHAVKRQPLLYCLGMGGFHNPLPQLLKALGWKLCAVPFYFRIVQAPGFLRNIYHLRKHPAGRALAAALAATGLGSLGVSLLNAARTRRPAEPVTVQSVREFSAWADEVWEQGKVGFTLAGVRSSAALNRLYPAHKEKFHRLKVSAGGKVAGWAVALDTQMRGHKQFGEMRLGSVIDCFAMPGGEFDVVHAAGQFLEARGVDLIVTNQSHQAWGAAFTRAGFLSGPSNYIFASAPKLSARLAPFETQQSGFHCTRGDGEGPTHL